MLDPFAEFPHSIAGNTYLFSDPSIVTNTPNFTIIRALAGMGVVVYAAAAPVFASVLLYKKRRKLQEPKVWRMYGFLVRGSASL